MAKLTTEYVLALEEPLTQEDIVSTFGFDLNDSGTSYIDDDGQIAVVSSDETLVSGLSLEPYSDALFWSPRCRKYMSWSMLRTNLLGSTP